jgi:hypothetical protein
MQDVHIKLDQKKIIIEMLTFTVQPSQFSLQKDGHSFASCWVVYVSNESH